MVGNEEGRGPSSEAWRRQYRHGTRVMTSAEFDSRAT